MQEHLLHTYLEVSLEAFEGIRQEALEKRLERFGRDVYIRGLIEFSSYCKCSCTYCGLRIEHQALDRFRLEESEILGLIQEGYALGYRSFVLQSGEDPYYTKELLGEIIKKAKEKHDIAITLSVGEQSEDTYKYWRTCGADRYLLKHECADEKLYNSFHPHSTFEERVSCLQKIKSLGYQTGSGFMIGLPNQTTDTLVKDLQLLKTLAVEMAGIGPFIPNAATPLGKCQKGDPTLTLKAVALARCLLPDAMLPVTTSLGVIDETMKTRCLEYGANVVMQKLEPIARRKQYALYPKEIVEKKSMLEEKEALIQWLTQAGWHPVFARGDYRAFKK